MEYLDQQTLVKLIQSTVILGVGLALFFGLKGRILRFAQWANLPRLAFAPIRAMLRYSIQIIAILLVIGRWVFDISTVFALLGSVLGLVAIGFVAVWSVLSNFLCTFVLVAFKPFSVGDEIELSTPPDGLRGRVIDLNLLFTTLQLAPGETVMIPNNTFFQQVFK